MAAGFAGGVLAGLVIWGMQMQRFRRDLFSRSPVRRYAALGHLSGQPSIENAHLLKEYVLWEKQPILRKRGQKLLSRMQAGLV